MNCPECGLPDSQCECGEFEHEAWCYGDNCDGFVDMDGGFVTVPCLCPCHEEVEVYA